MTFSISQMKANIKVVRPNLFKAQITLPLVNFSAADRTLISKFEFRCEATEIPGRTLATTDDQSTGTTKKLAYDVTYNDINFNIIASEDMNERYIFEKWINSIVLPSGHNTQYASGGIVEYYKNYAGGTVDIYQLRDDGQTVCKYTLHYAYPIQISPMNLTWGEFDTYQRFTVTMTYRYHTMEFPRVAAT
jgi:hypothetical protein